METQPAVFVCSSRLQQEIRFALDEVCSLLPGTLQEDCSILVNYYTTEVIYQFIRKYPANKICTLLKVCAAVDGKELWFWSASLMILVPRARLLSFLRLRLKAGYMFGLGHDSIAMTRQISMI